MSADSIDVEDYSFYTAQELSRILPMYRLSRTEYDVWNTLLGHMELGGQVHLTRAEMAHRLNVDPASVSRALSRLRQLGLIWRIGNRSQASLQINPLVAYKGTAQEWARALDNIPEDTPPVPVPDYDVRPPLRNDRNRLRTI